MTRKPRRNRTTAFKAKVAVGTIKGDKTLAELVEKFGVHANRITQRRSRLPECPTGVFVSPAENW